MILAKIFTMNEGIREILKFAIYHDFGVKLVKTLFFIILQPYGESSKYCVCVTFSTLIHYIRQFFEIHTFGTITKSKRHILKSGNLVCRKHLVRSTMISSDFSEIVRLGYKKLEIVIVKQFKFFNSIN